jgi:hypothetical protein
MNFLKEITAQIKAKKDAKKLRLIFFKKQKRANGTEFDAVINIMEFEPAPSILKSGQLSSWFRHTCKQLENEAESFKLEELGKETMRAIMEDSAFERS